MGIRLVVRLVCWILGWLLGWLVVRLVVRLNLNLLKNLNIVARRLNCVKIYIKKVIYKTEHYITEDKKLYL